MWCSIAGLAIIFTVDIDSVSPLSYSVSGSPMMADIARLDSDAGRIMAEYRMMTGNGTATEVKNIEAAGGLQQAFQRLYRRQSPQRGCAVCRDAS